MKERLNLKLLFIHQYALFLIHFIEYTFINLQFKANGPWDSLDPISMGQAANLCVKEMSLRLKELSHRDVSSTHPKFMFDREMIDKKTDNNYF